MQNISRCFYIALLAAPILFSCKKNNNGSATKLSERDKNFLINASYGNNDEVDAGGLASSKAANTGVQMFGSMMVNDHNAAESDLKTVADSLNTAIPDQPDSAHKMMKTSLMSLSGRAFDTTYIRGQIVDHQNTIALMQDEIANGQAAMVKRYANQYLPKVQMHLMMADSLMQVLKQP